VQAYCLIQQRADTGIWWLPVWSKTATHKYFKIMSFLIREASESMLSNLPLQLLGLGTHFSSLVKTGGQNKTMTLSSRILRAKAEERCKKTE